MLGMVNPCGPHQIFRCSGSVHALKTRSRGAAKTRVLTISRSELDQAFDILDGCIGEIEAAGEPAGAGPPG